MAVLFTLRIFARNLWREIRNNFVKCVLIENNYLIERIPFDTQQVAFIATILLQHIRSHETNIYNRVVIYFPSNTNTVVISDKL